MEPIFIGGTGRCGTTILKKILAQHSQVASLQTEARFIIDPGGILDLLICLSDRWTPQQADHAIQRFERLMRDCAVTSKPRQLISRVMILLGFSPWRYYQVGIANQAGKAFYDTRLAELIAELSSFTHRGSWTGSYPFRYPIKFIDVNPYPREVLAAILSRYVTDIYRAVSQGEKTHWVEDTPYNLLFSAELLELFPAMKLVHIYRDPRDVLASYRTKHWGGEDVGALARRIRAIYERWFLIRGRLPETCYREISLEAFAADKHGVLQELLDFVGLEYEPSLESIPLNKTNAGRWQRELTSPEYEQVFPILQPMIDRLGYS